MTDLHAWVLGQIAERERVAQGATEGPWIRWVDQEGIPGWDGFIMVGDSAAEGEECNPVANVYITEDAQHIALNGPDAVLRRCAADRELIADITAERHFVDENDCWYTCAAATEERDGGETCDSTRRGGPCDCGRDARVERRLRIIAEGYGWHDNTPNSKEQQA
ncbi:DUF6221 family protein [Streptomyces sp. LZ34]